ncbi:MAG: phosphatidylserine/phosphatidylglycerophosphate/cardiolipin synthase-like enzyme [Myxococcota bacterium]|jgi:phosphatidylserine/phosphatidylglycerophosphate/cardiolipin synthase-like enzyme
MAFRLLPLVLFAACGLSESAQDGRNDRALDANALAKIGDCQARETLALVNDPASTAEALKALGVHSRAATNIVSARVGEDGAAGTSDDVSFLVLKDVDDVSYVGPVAMAQLLTAGEDRCDGVSEPVPYTCPTDELLTFVNAPSTDVDALLAIDLHSRAARELVAHRDGADATPGTADDAVFASLEDVDAVRQVGPAAMATLTQWGLDQCGTAETLFSPQEYNDSHLTRVVELIDATENAIDVAMYSFRDTRVLNALDRAQSRGVSLRFLFNSASEDRRDPAGTRSAALEDMGIEVRWVNKVQHHKFAIFDGARLDLDHAATGILANGSGNWSYGAATRFDENMVVAQGDARLLLQFQKEFNLLWENGRLVVWNEAIAEVACIDITDEMIAAATGSDAIFTSSNFRTYDSSRYGPTFSSQVGVHHVRDALVELIESADESVWVASGHLRSRQIAEALIAKANEGVAVRVYLDGQEYVSAGYFGSEVVDFEECLATATTDGQTAGCYDDGQHFGYALHQAGVDVRFKHYAYRWDYHYADQMHHKYLVIDEDVVATGSYNLSNNAEFNTFENVAFLEAYRYPELVSDFTQNFETLWVTGETTFAAHLDIVRNGPGAIPLVYDAMALDWDQVTELKSAIRQACPAVDSDAFRQDPVGHQWCAR